MFNLVLATRNAHKVDEIRALVDDEFNISTLDDFSGVPVIAETGSSFTANATLKAIGLSQWFGCLSKPEFPRPVNSICYLVADDSGLEVDALNGAPGIYSARYASDSEGNASDIDNNTKLLSKMLGVPLEKRTARFVCAIAVAKMVDREGTPEAHLFVGTCEGRITEGPRGEKGFGYDSLFVPEGNQRTFGELGSGIKNGISHRARALEKFMEWLRAAGLQSL